MTCTKNLIILISLISAIIAQEEKQGMPIVAVPGFALNKGLLKNFFLRGLGSFLKDKEVMPITNKMHILDPSPLLRSMFLPVEEQAENACKILKGKVKEWNLEGGFILMGLSQGGIISRTILLKCEVGKFVRRLITMGTPNMGICTFLGVGTHTGISFILSRLTDWFAYTEFAKDNLSPYAYYRSLSTLFALLFREL